MRTGVHDKSIRVNILKYIVVFIWEKKKAHKCQAFHCIWNAFEHEHEYKNYIINQLSWKWSSEKRWQTANGGESNNAESTDKRYTAIDVHLSVQNGTKKEWKQRTRHTNSRVKERRNEKEEEDDGEKKELYEEM